MKRSHAKQKLIKRYFTIKDVDNLILTIEKNLRRTIKLNKALDLLSSIEIEVYDDDYDNLRRVTKLNKHFHKLSYEFYMSLEKLEDKGCIVKDLDIGIVDFYSKFEGREIFLCWKLGERKVKFWHEIDVGYAGRKPILDLEQK